MADIDNMRGDTLRVVDENSLDNMRGVTQRVIQENSIDNTRGVTYRVYNVNPAPAPVIDELNVTPSTSAQVITAPEGTDGYGPVNVAAVTSSIDANIVAGNIKKDVNILGVTGSYEGNVPTGTMYIISNGTYNVADKAIANVQVPTTAPTYYIEKSKDANNKLISSGSSVINLSGVTDIDNYVLYGAYYGAAFPNNTNIDLSSLTTVSGSTACQYTFGMTTGIANVDLSSLTTVSGYYACMQMFMNCSVTTIDLSSLTTVSGQSACSGMFQNCKNITSVDLGSLTTVNGYQGCSSMFENCYYLASVNLSSLSNITGGSCLSRMFRSAYPLTTLSFPSLTSSSFGGNTNQFNGMLQNVTGCTVHFPSNLQSVIGSWTDVVNGFGGTNTTVLFDLPATE